MSGGTATLDNSTVALNTGGGGVSATGGNVVAMSSLFTGNGSPDFQGRITAIDSLFQTAPSGTVTGSGNLIGVDPLLAAQGLTNNGGTTDTIALQAGSPALGAGTNPEHVLTDERGAPRTGAGGTANFNEDVTLSVASNQGPGTLHGTITMAAVNGVATFSGLSLQQVDSGYTITATTIVGVSSASTTAIQVTAAPATTLAVLTQPPASFTANTDFEVDVVAKDPYGNVDQSFTGPLTIEVSSGPQGAALGGTTTVSAVA